MVNDYKVELKNKKESHVHERESYVHEIKRGAITNILLLAILIIIYVLPLVKSSLLNVSMVA